MKFQERFIQLFNLQNQLCV